MDERWIVVPNWDRHQHYSDRNPTWIKVYTELNSRDQFLSLTGAERGLLLTIWLEYARAHGVLKVSTVGALMGAGWKHAQLKPLNDAGFIQLVASAPAQLRASSRASAEKEKEREQKSAHAHAKQKQTPAEPRTNAAAYQPFNDAPPETIEVDEATLEFARGWLTEHGLAKQ